MLVSKWSVLLLQILNLYHVSGVNILAITPVTSHSHHIWHRQILLELVKRGHNVTYFGPDRERNPTKNLTGIIVEGAYEKLYADIDPTSMTEQSSWAMTNLMYDWALLQCDLIYASDAVHTLLSYPDDSFDLIIIEVFSAECMMPLVQKFRSPPLIGTSPFGLVPWINFLAGGHNYPSYIPSYTQQFTDRMTFRERVINFIIDAYSQLYWKFIQVPAMESFVERRYGPQKHSVWDMMKNVSMFLVNSDPVINEPRPLPPTVIPVSGIHIRKPNPLPQDLQEFMETANHGVIVFSLGSNIRSDQLSAENIQILLQAFARLPQKVIWKWESDRMPGTMPPNVLVRKWLPQSDLLAHRNTKLFFTHAGGLSTQEAILRGVPMVGMPFFFDQNSNLNKIVQRGYALALPYLNLTVENAVATLTEVLENRKYRDNVQRASRRFRDQPQQPMDRAIFWIEYVLRHGGAHHLQPAAIHMPLYQTSSLDVLAFLLFILILPVWVVVKLLSGRQRRNARKRKQH